ncbi:hypothetical protein [Insolitispirillum peregrinum]|uniref:hypothetical protein n=1 Tax=Insolitispirillum peregrinum TaxID=80876 RepID=UPI003612A68B
MHITYLFDPLCGWFYGAGPALERLAARDDVTLDLAPTGLFADDGARAKSVFTPSENALGFQQRIFRAVDRRRST